VETAFIPADRLDLSTLQAQACGLAETQAADLFSETQLAHAERLADEREKMKRYYHQQERAVSQIAIENIRQARQRELLDRRRADLAALDRRLTLVPDLAVVGMAIIQGDTGAEGDAIGRAGQD